MSDVIKDVLMGKLFGTSGTSSGGGSSGGGGSSSAVSPKEVNFYDYDGTCVHAYTVAEAQALSELPAGPEHPGLVFQGWNWSLEGVKGLTRAMNIGAMYTTDDGTTRLYITLQEGRTSPMLGVGVNGTVTVDWGDGTEPDVLTGTSVSTAQFTPNHAYAAPGDYVIRLMVDGEMGFVGNSTANQQAYILRYASGGALRNRVYQNALRRVEIGDGVTKVGKYAFYGCASLELLTISRSVEKVEARAFETCYSLSFVAFPNSMTSIGSAMFCNCYSLETLSLPDGNTLDLAYFNENCYSLSFVAFPDSVTGIGDRALNNCYGLASIAIPGGVTNIGTQAFANCYGVAYYDFTACTAVPTLASTAAFNNIPDDCEIRVPTALYDEWIAATNWATYASQIKAY